MSFRISEDEYQSLMSRRKSWNGATQPRTSHQVAAVPAAEPCSVRYSPHQSALDYLAKHPDSYKGQREHYDQVKVFRYFELLPNQDIYDHLAAIPNGGHRRKGEAGKMKAEGQKPGYPDTTLDLPRGVYHGLRIEMKADAHKELDAAKGRVSSDQLIYLKRLTAAGYYCTTCWGAQDAIEVILKYFFLEPNSRMPAREFDLVLNNKHSTAE